jgi:hypothetical protein
VFTPQHDETVALTWVCVQPPGSGHVRFVENTFWKERYCVHHRDLQNGVVTCTSCFRLRVPDSPDIVDLHDGRHTCLSCLDLLLRDTDDAQPLYQDVLRWYGTLGMPHKEQPPFMLVQHAALNDYSAQEGRSSSAGAPVTHTRGICLSEWHETIEVAALGKDQAGLPVWLTQQVPLTRQRRVSVTAILVLSGMAWMLTGAVLAHELMHAWLRMEGFEHLPQQVEEGMCQLMAYLWLEAQQPKVCLDCSMWPKE